MTADVRVVVVTYNSEGFLGPFLDSVAESSQREIAVTVSDNGSRDSSLAIAEGRPGVTVLRNGANLGYGSAANRGAAGAAEEWLVIANPDVRLTPDCLDTLLEAAERWPTAGVLGPGILTPEGELYPSARLLPSLRRGVGHATLGWVWPSNPWSTAYRNDRGEPREGVVGWLSGSFMVVHRAAFEAVGGFDEGFFMYFEDVDLCDRLGRQGWTSVYVPQAKVLHVGGHSTTKDPASADLMARTHHRSAYRYLSGRYAGPARAPLRWAIGAGLTVRYGLSRVVAAVAHTAVPTRRIRPTRIDGGA
mgnify:FL=1|jgi:N-acetylglucosaminyl-diphospho-decaprenol L-rhamnosyltransferase